MQFKPVGLPPRSHGIHVSEIIRDILNRAIIPGQRRPEMELTPEEKRRMGNYAAIGWVWEELVRMAMLEMEGGLWGDMKRYVRAGEIERDGIIGTPDWVDTKDEAVIEFKATWRSSRRPIETDFWHWWVQIKAYCWMLGTNDATLVAFFVNGDYRDSGPQIRMWKAGFKTEELKDNWKMLYNHASRKGWIQCLQ